MRNERISDVTQQSRHLRRAELFECVTRILPLHFPTSLSPAFVLYRPGSCLENSVLPLPACPSSFFAHLSVLNLSTFLFIFTFKKRRVCCVILAASQTFQVVGLSLGNHKFFRASLYVQTKPFNPEPP